MIRGSCRADNNIASIGILCNITCPLLLRSTIVFTPQDVCIGICFQQPYITATKIIIIQVAIGGKSFT